MRILVTGASGFLGSSVLRSLVKRGHEVVALSRQGNLLGGTSPSVRWEKADLLAPQEISALMKKNSPDGLIHLAWDTPHGTYWNSPENLLWTGTSLYLFESFVRYGGKRFVAAGTSAEYQWGNDAKLEETKTPLMPDSLYGVSKNALRSILEAWADSNNISWAWGRIFNIFGPGEKKERLIPRVIQSLRRGEPVSFDDGLLYRDFLHIDDAGDAFAALYDSDVQGTVNIASGEPISIRQLLLSIAELLGTPNLIRFDDRPSRLDEPRTVVASIERLREEVEWFPADNFQNRLISTCNWWKNNI